MRRVASKVNVDELKGLYTGGLSLKNVAKQVGIGHGSVKRLLLESGVPIRKCLFSGVDIKKDQLEELYIRCELSTTEVGKRLGISQSTVLDKLLEHGIPTRNHSESAAIAKKYGRDNHGPRLDRVSNGKGYWLVKRPGHLNAHQDGYVFEHIIVWEEAYGEQLGGRIIHHINGNGEDNRICNLHAFPDKLAHFCFHGYARRECGIAKCPRHLLRGYLAKWLHM